MIAKDFRAYPLRFILEIVAWMLSIGCAVTMALTAPTPPLLEMYIAWVSGSSLYAWAAWTRGSFGMFGNYFLLVCIDLVGLSRMVIGV